MSQKIYLTILKIGVVLGFFSVFLVFSDLLFPYITSKQIYFNVLIELLTIFWLVFILKYPSYNPFNKKNKSLITFGLVAYFVAILLSSIFGVDFNLSYWGDVERMLGFFHLAHFLIFYLIIITVFKTWRDWQVLFLISVGCAIFISIIGIAGNPYSRLGNTAYMAGYLIFNIYFCFILFAKEKIKNLKWIYLLPLLVMIPAFVRADSSGAYVGLGFSIMVLFFLAGALAKNKNIKIVTWSILGIMIVFVGVLFLARNTEMAQNNPIFQPIKEISFQKNTFQTRLISWRAAFRDFPSHPMFGTGYGNYAITFDKYFDPIFYSYTASETFFDRAHNNIIDILSTTGTLGLLTYLSIFVFVLIYLIKGYRSGRIKSLDFIIVFSLITAYFVQNLAVFDSLVTYISLMVLLGYVYWLYNYNENEEEGNIESDKGLDNQEIFTFIIFGFIALLIVYQYNVKPIRMLRGTIAGQMEINQGNTDGMYKAYQDALSIGTPLDRDSRTSLIRAIVSNPTLLSNVSPKKATEILEYTIEQSEINLEYNQSDSLNLLLHAQLLDLAAKFNRSNVDKFVFYSDQSLEIVNRALESSPGRVNIYFFLSQVYITRNQLEDAIEAMRYAVSLNPDYIVSTCQLAKTLFLFNDEENAYKEMDKCLSKGGIGQITTKSLAVKLLNHYTELGDSEKVLLLYQSLTRIDGGDTQVWISMAQFYKEMGDKENAIKSAQKAADLDPSLQGSVDAFVNGL